MANLVLNGKSIDTIEEIAENFVEEDVLREFKSGSLATWLEEYDYGDELARIRVIKPTASNIRVLSGIIEALNLDDDVIAQANAHREGQRHEEFLHKSCEEHEKGWDSDTFVQMLRDAFCSNNDLTDDDVMAAAQLIKTIYFDSLQKISAGVKPIAMKDGIISAIGAVASTISKLAKKVGTVEELTGVATFFADGDEEIGKVILEAMDKVGYDGTITVEESRTLNTMIDVVDGMQFDKGYLSPYFVTTLADLECVLENPYILLFEEKISNCQDMLSLLQNVNKMGRPLMVIADDIKGEALAMLIENSLYGNVAMCAVNAPGFGNLGKAFLEDIAILTGGKLISTNLENVTVDMLGTANKVIVNRNSTTIIGAHGKFGEISARVALIKKQIEEASTTDYNIERLQKRLAKLAGGVAIIKVGADSEAIMKDQFRRMDCALYAARGAVKEGVVIDDGNLCQRCQIAIKKLALNGGKAMGASIVSRAIEYLFNLCHKNDVKHGMEANEGNDVCMYLVKDILIILQNVAFIVGDLLTTPLGGTDKKKRGF